MKEDDIDADSLKAFVEAFVKSKLKPHINSEPKPKWSKNALIHKVVGSTFENVNVVLNPANNVMVKLCFPDNQDCKAAEQSRRSTRGQRIERRNNRIRRVRKMRRERKIKIKRRQNPRMNYKISCLNCV